jgi:hypothetical protein
MPQRTPTASDPTFSLLLGGDKLLDKRYRPIRRIGKGGYGIVYEVEHAALKKRFALKVLNQQVSRGAEMIRRFRQEALATAKTEHPNIVSVTDFGTTPTGQVYLVMELLHGETLLKMLRRDKAVTLSRAIPLLAAACHALDTVHKQGIVHRDRGHPRRRRGAVRRPPAAAARRDPRAGGDAHRRPQAGGQTPGLPAREAAARAAPGQDHRGQDRPALRVAHLY